MPTGPSLRTANAVSADVDRLLSPKTLGELGVLEVQVSKKLRSDEPIDVEYWEQLLRSIAVYKAKAELKDVYKCVAESRLKALKAQQKGEAELVQKNFSPLDSQAHPTNGDIPDQQNNQSTFENSQLPPVVYSNHTDPEPLVQILPEDKALGVVKKTEVLSRIVSSNLKPQSRIARIDIILQASERRKVTSVGSVPMRARQLDKQPSLPVPPSLEPLSQSSSRFAATPNEDFSQATKALYEREVARGVQEDEEIFTGEEEVLTLSKPQWANKHRPRKPRYFNRVQMGYEWNKYNQTHYDHDNPPPKVVQGYKFNVFYPDLIDKTKAPTYRIERENGRKRGQSFAPAGEEDTCLIRFISGPPYEDLAFRIVDKEWDYSAKRERGFRSSFDKVSHKNILSQYSRIY